MLYTLSESNIISFMKNKILSALYRTKEPITNENHEKKNWVLVLLSLAVLFTQLKQPSYLTTQHQKYGKKTLLIFLKDIIISYQNNFSFFNHMFFFMCRCHFVMC